MAEQYVIIPGTNQKVYEGSVVILFRLPNLEWILHNGYYNYGGKRRKGWYFSSIPADTQMPVFKEDLVGLRVKDGPEPVYPPVPPHPYPPGPMPPIPPTPPAPIPIPYTPRDKKQVDASMITLANLEERDRFGNEWLVDGKIVRVNDIDGQGTVEYYSWDSKSCTWQEASLGYRYMTRHEIEHAIADDIVAIAWSNEYGSLVLTNNGGTEVEPVSLTGVAHNPVYTQEDLTLRIPVYGQDDFVMKIPRDMHIISIRFEPEYHFPEPDPHVGPAIVVVISNGDVEYEIAGDASGLYNIYEGVETATTRVNIESATAKISCDVKLSAIENNPLKVDNEGMWVDLSGVVAKKQIDTGMLLVADGTGQFTYAGDGIGVDVSTAISDLEHPERFVVTANLISDAIVAAIDAYDITISQRIEGIEARITALENKVDFGAGENDEILTTNDDGIVRSGFKIGGPELSTTSTNTVATEQAMTSALSWLTF